MSDKTKTQSKWAEMGGLLWIAFPQWVINRLTQRGNGKGFAIKAIPFIIIFLSMASITNLSTQAYSHHANFSSYMTGAGIACLVPIAVLAAMMIEGQWSHAFWAMAVVFAGVSGTIQYNIYHTGNDIMAIAEAIAFGYGVPLSEVMLAIMEGQLVLQFDRRKNAEYSARIKAEKEVEDARIASELAIKSAQEQKAHDDAAEADEREYSRQKRQIELAAYEAKLAQDAEIKREKALTELRIKEQKAASKAVTKTETKLETLESDNGKNDPDERELMKRMIALYQSDPTISNRKMGEKIGVSHTTVSNLLSNLVSKDVVHVTQKGRSKTVTVNGKLPAFMAGEI